MVLLVAAATFYYLLLILMVALFSSALNLINWQRIVVTVSNITTQLSELIGFKAYRVGKGH